MIFLNADATPQGPDWLGPLVSALADPQVAAVFGRQIPRPNCEAVFARDYEQCFQKRRELAHWEHFFSMVSSGLRRDVWAHKRFSETTQYSEDDEYTRRCRADGYRICYSPDSVVMHSHDYTPRQAYKRSFGEAWALAEMPHSAAENSKAPPPLVLGWARDLWRDLAYCWRTGRLAEWPHAFGIRFQQRLGRLHGFRVGRQMHLTDFPT